MDTWTSQSEAAFDAYVEALVEVVGHADRAEPLKDYCLGLLMPVEENVEETLTYYRLPLAHHKHMKSTNMLERLSQALKRRTLVVRIAAGVAPTFDDYLAPVMGPCYKGGNEDYRSPHLAAVRGGSRGPKGSTRR
jgi:hypothetical protein